MKKEKFKSFWLNNNKRNLKVCIVAVALIFLIIAVFQGVKILRWLDQVDQESGFDFKNADETYFEDESDFSAIHEADNVASLEDMLYKWSTNGGEHMTSKNIVNVLLIGVDSRDGLASGGNTDAMMVVSLNKKTKKITIVSIMRDSFVYMDINGKKRFFKINAAYNWGGPATLVNVIEDNYKIEINNYICVDFATFPRIIDSLGGVAVEVKPSDARCIKKYFSYTVETGDSVILGGQEALAFSRIRKCDVDGDVSRTRRQRAVIMAMIESVQGASNSQFNDALDNVFPNIRTNYRKAEILSLGSQALMQKWAEFDIIQITSPTEAVRASATIDGRFVWVVDFPLEARAVQLALYGSTNIVLEDGRVSILKMLKPKTSASAGTGTTAAESSASTQTDATLTTEVSGETSTSAETSTTEATATTVQP